MLNIAFAFNAWEEYLPMKNADYQTWIEQISLRFKNSQIKAAIKVNDEMLRFYWQLGKEIAERKSLSSLGNEFYKQLSKDLKELLPTVKSFSPTNLKYMQYFYELYPNPQLGDFTTDLIFNIPWGHNKAIIDRCKNKPKQALFYIQKTLENSWSRAVLLNFLDSDLYSREGKAISNFANTLPKPQSDLAQAITKDPYNFDFLTIRERYDEKELKDALMANTEKFLLELGKGFAAEAQYALEATNQPIGISSYELSQLIPDDYQKSLPTIEEIEAEFNNEE